MKFASVRQITVMAAAWVLLLFSYDYHKNPKAPRVYWAEIVSGHARRDLSSRAERPHLSITMNHLCCSGCLSDVRAALAPFSWLGKPVVNEVPSQEEADLGAAAAGNANRLEIDVLDVGKADFVALDRAIREVGLAVERMELSGIPHFQLEAEVKHVCCTLCSTSLGGLAEMLRSRHETWVEGVSVHKVERKIVVSARYDSVVDVRGLVAALEAIGFSPSAIRVVFET